MLTLASALLVAQAAIAAAPPPTLEQDRLALCAEEARRDPPTALVNASGWLAEAAGPARSAPQHCLGLVYTSLLRWQAAEDAFLAAREALPAGAVAARSRLAAMAGNAALADGRAEAALTAFTLARSDAEAAGETAQTGLIAADSARALVSLNRPDEAAAMLGTARRLTPQDAGVWLLSATLSRRLDQLDEAQAQIETAAALAPADPALGPAIGLEAGLIAALAGREAAARASWQSIVATASGSPEAAAARAYLAQLDVQTTEGAPQP